MRHTSIVRLTSDLNNPLHTQFGYTYENRHWLFRHLKRDDTSYVTSSLGGERGNSKRDDSKY